MNNFKDFRPHGFTGKGDRYLLPIALDLADLLIVTADDFEVERELYFDEEEWEEIAGILVEYAEDVHNGIGIWNSYERYNYELFETRLPLTLEYEDDLKSPETIDEERIIHILWILHNKMIPEYIISPFHSDLYYFAEIAADFLVDRFRDVPKSSGVKMFLNQPNEYGWNVKEKLFWLGTKSYMFRTMFLDFMRKKLNDKPAGHRERNEENTELLIPLTDDFICQETTCWSGLGVIDILAGILDITPEQEDELRNWYERHLAYYKVLSVNKNIIEAENILNNKPYNIRVDKKMAAKFHPGAVVFGSLVKWNDEWYWSGKQSLIGKVSEEVIKDLIKDFNRTASFAIYRYDKDKLKMALENTKRNYDKFVEFFGDDFVIFPVGKTMMTEMQNLHKKDFETIPEEDIKRIMKEHNKKNPWPEMHFPKEVINCNKGICVYYKHNEGMEIMINFNDILSGFKKKGVDLNDNERNSIMEFIFSEAISPEFVYKLVDKYGFESIFDTFLIKDNNETSLECLLRQHKGHFYRKRYPTMSLV